MKRGDLHLFYIFFIVSLFLLFFFIEGRITGNTVKEFFTDFKNTSVIQPRVIDDSGNDGQQLDDSGETDGSLDKNLDSETGDFVEGDVNDQREEVMVTTYYIDGNLGADCTDGTYSIASRTCGSGIDGNAYNHPQDVYQIMQPGDTISIREGTYRSLNNQRVMHFVKTGLEGQPIIVQSYNNEEVFFVGSPGFPVIEMSLDNKPCGCPNDPQGGQFGYIIIRGLDISNGSKGIDSRHSKYITIEDNVVHNLSAEGIIFTKQGGNRTDGRYPSGGHHLIRNNEVYYNSGGIIVKGEHSVIENNHAHHNYLATYPSNSDGIVCAADYCVVRNNIVHDNSDDGIDVGDGQGGEGQIRGPRWNIITGNIVYNNGCTYNFCGDGSGIKLQTLQGGLHPGGGFIVANNIVFANRLKNIDVDTRPENTTFRIEQQPDLYFNNVVHDGGISRDADGIIMSKVNSMHFNNIVFNKNNLLFWDTRFRANTNGPPYALFSDYNLMGDRWIKDEIRIIGDDCGRGDDSECLWDQNSSNADPLHVNYPAVCARTKFFVSNYDGALDEENGRTTITVSGINFDNLGARAGDRITFFSGGNSLKCYDGDYAECRNLLVQNVSGDKITLTTDQTNSPTTVNFNVSYYPIETNDFYLDSARFNVQDYFVVGDIVEYENDGVIRRVTNIDTGQNSFAIDNRISYRIGKEDLICNWKTNVNLVEDFRLQSNSPGIDEGIDIRVALQNILDEIYNTNQQNVNVTKWEEVIAFDFQYLDDINYGFFGSAPDIGAYEYSTGNAFCGNNQKEDGEACDGNDFGGATCQTYGYEYGFLTCSQSCSLINTTTCIDEVDTDGDYLKDDWENNVFGNLLETGAGDYDSDNVINLHEYYFGSDAKDDDSDGANGDNVAEFDEIFVYHTNPNHWDTDYDHNGNGLKFDYDEIFAYNTTPFNVDTDGDGYEDGDEIDSGKDPFVRDPLSFTFVDGNGVTHTRTKQGVQYIDSVTGEPLEIIPWLEMGDRNTVFDSRDEIMYEITKQGIVSWARAGATKVGVVGGYGWMRDLDANRQGYQNQYVQELSQLGRDNGVEIIFGMKLVGSFITSWDQFFHNGNQKFTQLRDVIQGATQLSGTNEFIIEGETPYQWVVDAYYNNTFDLNAQDMQNFRNNIQLLAETNAKIYMWAPFFYIDSNGNPKTIPQDRSNKREDLEGIYTQLLININSVLGDNYGYLGTQEGSYVRAGQRQKPYGSHSIKIFTALEREGIYNYYQHKPINIYLGRGPGSVLDAGPSELGVDMPRFYGEDLDNTNFRHLPFDKVFLYPGAFAFDWVGESVSNYFNNDLYIQVRPSEIISEGQPITIDFTVHDEQNRNLDIGLDVYDIYKGISPDISDVPNIETDFENNKVIFEWIPGYHRGKYDKGYYWIYLKVMDEEGNLLTLQPLRIEVQNYGLNSLTTDNADFDSDGYGNYDEITNGNNERDVENSPTQDNDADFISDLNDMDDDNDFIADDRDACPYTLLIYSRNANKFGCPIPNLSEFNDRSTSDLYGEDLFNVVNLTLGVEKIGVVKFTEEIQLLQEENYNGRDVWMPVDLVSNVDITQKRIFINSTSLSELDKRAEILFYNISFVNPRILRDGKVCEDCIILNYTNGDLIFEVSGFSEYTVDEGEGNGSVCGNDICESDEDANSCYSDCGICGNSITEGTEQCDDGNLENGDGCNSQCQNETGGNNGGTNDGGSSGSGSSGSGGSNGNSGSSGGDDSSGRQSPSRNAQCEDGVDNDNDGLIDYPLDLGCVSYSDSSEEEIVRENCIEDWICEDWTQCVDNEKMRLCYDNNDCGSINSRPRLEDSCLEIEESNRIILIIISILVSLVFGAVLIILARRNEPPRSFKYS